MNHMSNLDLNTEDQIVDQFLPNIVKNEGSFCQLFKDWDKNHG